MLLLAAALALLGRRAAGAVNDLEQRLRRLELHRQEIRRTVEQLDSLRAAQQLAEGAMQGTTATVRAVHKGIASIPFGILEAIPVTRDTTRIVRGIHDLTADAVYGTISTVNRVIGDQLRKGLPPAPESADALPSRPEDMKNKS